MNIRLLTGDPKNLIQGATSCMNRLWSRESGLLNFG